MSTSEPRGDPLNLAPHSQEAEECVLGSLLMNPEAYNTIAPILTEGDFFLLRHAWIYAAFTRCYTRDGSVDTRTLAAQLQTEGKLDDIGGEAYLNYLPTTMPTALHGELYARLVARAAMRRNLLGAAGEIARLAHDQELEIEAVLSKSQQLIYAVTNGMAGGEGVSWFQDEANEYHTVAWEWKMGQATGEMTTPWPDLNAILDGVAPGEVLVIAGAPGTGKSAMMMQLALHGERNGYQGLMFPLEMSERSLIMRVIAQETGITTKEQRHMTDEQWSAFVAWHDTTRNTFRRLAFDKKRSYTAPKIAARCRQFANEYGLDFVVIDYLQLMAIENSRGQNRSRELGESMRLMKELAMEINTRVIIGSQFSRDFRKAGRAPTLADLRDSGEIEEHCDKAVFIHAPDGYETEQLIASLARDAIVAKNRNGALGTAPMIWLPQRVKFESAARIELPSNGKGKARGSKE